MPAAQLAPDPVAEHGHPMNLVSYRPYHGLHSPFYFVFQQYFSSTSSAPNAISYFFLVVGTPAIPDKNLML